MNYGLEILELHKVLQEMPEQQTLLKIRHFSTSIDIFQGNYHDLIKQLQTHNNPRLSIHLMDINNKEELHSQAIRSTNLLNR